MNIIGKSLLATVAIATLALGTASPVMAQARDNRGDTAWHADARSNDQRNIDQRNVEDRGFQDRFDPARPGPDRAAPGSQRFAVGECTRAVAQRSGGNTQVTAIDAVFRTRDGFRIRGEIGVNNRGWHGGLAERGMFTCRVDHARVVALDLRGPVRR